jgi:hypothetical protein
MRNAGYNNLTLDELIRLRLHRIDADEIRRMKEK